jgi:PII-like signaling protein
MESEHLLEKILSSLKKDTIRGVSVFRAISGCAHGVAHTSAFMDLSLDLPLAVEFFDQEDKVTQALNNLNVFMKPEHMVCWNAQANEVE